MIELSHKHRAALLWFQNHLGDIYQDASWFSGTDVDQLLASKAKGIYKPQDWDYALSIRISDDGPYRDGNIEYRADGSWKFSYLEESQAGTTNDTLYTNRALKRCMDDKIPVGVFMKTALSAKSREYEIAGLGLPTSYDRGTFMIEGPYELQVGGSQSVAFLLDAGKRRVVREIVQRQGQGIFRRRLLEAYSSRCAVTQYDANSAVEAAHIRPYSGPFSNDIGNGILLRADIHTLFDLRQIAINPETLRLAIGRELKKTRYSKLENRAIFVPTKYEFRPRSEFLRYAWEEYCSKSA